MTIVKTAATMIAGSLVVMLAGCGNQPTAKAPVATEKERTSTKAPDFNNNGVKDTVNGETAGEKLDSYLKSVDKQIDKLSASMSNMADDVKQSYNENFGSVKSQRDTLRKQWEDMKDATKDKWEAAKDKMDAAMKKLDKDLQDLGDKIKANTTTKSPS